ncbi:helix-turn-helix domain-containing protein [Flavobacterium oreochromis]|uniref:helix-turn-helix domain-containing protein n=1 Tax=Flavobacterium oreochromis TaxID=2906078 RepID=UPI0021648F56|nr:helix-turn-helix domain-containing protein [Flavobacterium oreochromis]
MSRQYLNKIFTKQVKKSPTEFRKIHRFRISLVNQIREGNFTKLSYESQFYDQSHFVRDFKDLTSFKPTDFLKCRYKQRKYMVSFLT